MMLKLGGGESLHVFRPEGEETILELAVRSRYSCEVEFKVYDGQGLLFHLGKTGKPDYWARVDVGVELRGRRRRRPYRILVRCSRPAS